jgi:hypothetical protein
MCAHVYLFDNSESVMKLQLWVQKLCLLGSTQASIHQRPTPGVKQLGCEADHSPPPSAKMKNVWSYTSTPPIHLHGVVLN